MEGSPRDWFETQFSKREKFKIGSGTAEVVDIIPPESTDKVPVTLAPAWSVTTKIYKPALRTIGSERRIIAFDLPRSGDGNHLSNDETEKLKDRLDEYPPEQLRKALGLLEILKKKEVRCTDVIAHSQGFVHALIAADIASELYPGQIRNILAFGPAGLIGKDSFGRLMSGWKDEMKPWKSRPSMAAIPVSEEDKERAKKEGRVAIEYPAIQNTAEGQLNPMTLVTEGGGYLAGNPLRSLREAVELSGVDVSALLEKLHNKGIGIIIMSGVDDPMFPAKKMAELMKKGSVDGFLSVRAGHDIQENERFLQVALQMLEKLRQKQTKVKDGTSASAQVDKHSQQQK